LGRFQQIFLYLKFKSAQSVSSDNTVEIAVGGYPAKKANNRTASDWLFFQCHKLGGLDITFPTQTIGREHHGAWYKFGAKTASLKNDGTYDSDISGLDWSNTTKYPYQNDQLDWSEANNPCSAGRRLATKDD
jgi:hypothetical protein